MKPYKKLDQWDLYRMCFEDGQEVALIDTDDQVYFGKLTTTPDAAVLSHGRGTKRTTIPWIECRFMCHDGFPYRKLNEKFSDPKVLVEHLKRRNVAKIVRRHLRETFWSHVPKAVRHAVFGDPFEICGPVTARIFHPGNTGWRWYDLDYEECVVLEARDGAKAQLWELATVLHLEVA